MLKNSESWSTAIFLTLKLESSKNKDEDAEKMIEDKENTENAETKEDGSEEKVKFKILSRFCMKHFLNS